MPAGYITAGPTSVSAGNGQPLACAAVLTTATSKVVKAPLSMIVTGAITSELPLPFTFTANTNNFFAYSAVLSHVQQQN